MIGYGGQGEHWNLTQVHQRILSVEECEKVYRPETSQIVKNYRDQEAPYGFDNLLCVEDLVSQIS